jgi:uncharacterized protein (TIGR03435 family)
MAKRRAFAASLIALMPLSALGQFAASTPAFEVASVKPHQGPLSTIDISTAGPRLNVEGESVRGLIMYAYGMKNYQVVQTPALGALKNKTYDILAKADGDGIPTKAEFRHMLQLLLVDRFKMVIHHEVRQMPVYALIVGKNGPKFKESAPNATYSATAYVVGHNETMAWSKATMDEITTDLPIYTDRPVVDKTGLTGTYDIKLEATIGSLLTRDPEETDISLATAVQEQLGLKLVPQNAMVDVIVVDHVENPSEN